MYVRFVRAGLGLCNKILNVLSHEHRQGCYFFHGNMMSNGMNYCITVIALTEFIFRKFAKIIILTVNNSKQTATMNC